MRIKFWRGSGLTAVILVLASLGLAAEPAAQGAPSIKPAAPLILPDGTAVHLRFAQPVFGLSVASRDIAIKKGTNVRMVVAEDVRIHDKIAIAKGAPAQVTVTGVWRPDNKDIRIAGVSVRLDWVTLITGGRAALRPRLKGKASSVDLEVLGSKGGIDVRPFSLSRELVGPFSFDLLFSSRLYRQKAWIPTGARMIAFLDGDVQLQPDELESAQKDLPIPNQNGVLYVFRTKDHDGPSPLVRCDQVEVGILRSRQTAVAEIPPGTHLCNAGTSPATQLVVEGSVEYYVRLTHSSTSDWVLKVVEPEEGEDRSAETELLPPWNAVDHHASLNPN